MGEHMFPRFDQSQLADIIPISGADVLDRLRCEAFIDPSARIPLADQLRLVRVFWNTLGIAMPLVDEAQIVSPERFEQVSGMRILPVPVSPGVGLRREIIERAQARLPGTQTSMRLGILAAGKTFGALLHEARHSSPREAATEARLVLRYICPDGGLQTRAGYCAALSAAGLTVEESRVDTPAVRLLWTFPVINMYELGSGAVRRPVTALSSLVTPELIVTAHALHAAGGRSLPMNRYACNELVCMVNASGQVIEWSVATVATNQENITMEALPPTTIETESYILKLESGRCVVVTGASS